MKAFLFKAIFSRVGPLIKAGVSFLLGKVVVLLAAVNVTMTAELQQSLSYVLTAGAWIIIDWLLNKYAGDNIKAIQEAVGMEAIDRWVGPKTVATIEEMAAKAKRPTEILD